MEKPQAQTGFERIQDRELVAASVGRNACMVVDIVADNEEGTEEDKTRRVVHQHSSPRWVHDRGGIWRADLGAGGRMPIASPTVC